MAMIRLPRDFKEFLRLLNAHKVEYLLAGGYDIDHGGAIVLSADSLRSVVTSCCGPPA